MTQTTDEQAAIGQRIKQIIRRDLKLGDQETIEDDTPLVGGEFDLDSLDVLMLITSLEKEFGVKINSKQAGREVFASVGSLSRYVAAQADAAGSAAPCDTLSATSPQQLAAAAGQETGGAFTAAAIESLPHRPPFRFLSRVTALEPGERAEGVWSLTGQEAFFAGHFPGRPVVPGVLITEALAQLSGLLAGHGPQDSGRMAGGMLAQINITLRHPVAPPADLLLRSRALRAVEGLHLFAVAAEHRGRVVAEGELTLQLSPQIMGEPG